MSEKVYIFGHKNPDTDSICSSLVEEILDKKNGWNDVWIIVSRNYILSNYFSDTFFYNRNIKE